MPMTNVVLVSDDGMDYEIEAIARLDGSIRMHCHDSHGAVAYIPVMTPEEARRVAASLTAAADFADTK